jgi:hypothetical protein
MEQPSAPRPGQAGRPANELPPDFARRIAQKVVFTLERERDPDEATDKIANIFIRNLSGLERSRLFIDMIDELLNSEETSRSAAMAWVAIVLHREDDPRFENMVSDLLDAMIVDHRQLVKPNYSLEYRRKSFSFYARNLGDAFIAMVEFKNELYEVCSHIYSLLIRKEVALEMGEKDRRAGGRRISLAADQAKPKVGKKLFDDVVDYVHARGEVRSDTLTQQNPNEYIAALADRMRGTRRYVIQDIMAKQAAEKRKEAEKELSEKLASAEEIIQSREAFKKALNLFWAEKRYNIKYLSVEKVRVTLQVSGIIIGIVYFLAGYLRLYTLTWWEGILIAIGMYLYARFFVSRQGFRNFFPNDVSKELEVVLGSITPVLRKMSKEQMDAFMVRQVKDPVNVNLLPMLPEFFKYVFAVMPDRKNTIVTVDDMQEILENLEMDITRVIRTSAPRHAED